MKMDRNELIFKSVESLEKIRRDQPKIHCLTSFVAMNFTANMLLALGAVPSMTMDESNIREFVGSSSGLLINLGQMDEWRRRSMPAAIKEAKAGSKPWLLDPVKINRSALRLAKARELAILEPLIIKCNQDEQDLMAQTTDRSSLVVTGKTDRILLEGRPVLAIRNGTIMSTKVTAMGCGLGAVMTAFLCVEEDPVAAAAQALLVFNAASEQAAEKASGPGSFAMLFLDALFSLRKDDILNRAAVEIL